MQKWEYITEFVWASAKDEEWEKYRQEIGISAAGVQKYSPITMIPELNFRGEGGWELVHMQPVVVGKNHDIGFPGDVNHWSSIYFCAWKRPKP